MRRVTGQENFAEFTAIVPRHCDAMFVCRPDQNFVYVDLEWFSHPSKRTIHRIMGANTFVVRILGQ